MVGAFCAEESMERSELLELVEQAKWEMVDAGEIDRDLVLYSCDRLQLGINRSDFQEAWTAYWNLIHYHNEAPANGPPVLDAIFAELRLWRGRERLARKGDSTQDRTV